MNDVNRIKRIVLAGVVMLSLIFTPMTAHAESFAGEDGWTVSFNGEKMSSTFKSNTIADNVYNKLQPGDDVTFHLTLSSTASYSTNWYMTNEVINSLENTRKYARSGGYLYELVYINNKGEKNVIFSSDTIGGEKTQSAGLGLHEATDNLEDWFFLDTLTKGQKGEIVLNIALDGETQGNAYQDTLADLQMNFAVENSPIHKTYTIVKIPSVKTGDESGMMFWSVVSFGSGIAALFLAIFLKRRGKDDEK